MISFPNINPIAVQFGKYFAIRWYSLAYLLGFILCRFIVIRVNIKDRFATQKQIDDMASGALLFLILGARLAYVLFYQPVYYFYHPLEIFFIWNGGLAWHGGALGLIFSLIYFSKKFGFSPAKVLDPVSVVIPVALFFGRIFNFINAELYGRPTNSVFGMIFPSDTMQIPRHPSQLYEAATEGILLFVIMLILFHVVKRSKAKNKDYLVSSGFIFFYSILRFICEFWREPDVQVGTFFGLSLGQILCILQLCAMSIVLFFIRLSVSRNVSNK